MKSMRKLPAVLILMLLSGLASMACLYTRHDIYITLDIRQIKDTATSIEDVVAGDKPLEALDRSAAPRSMSDSPRLARLAALVDLSTPAAAQGNESTAIRTMTPALRTAIQARQERFDEIRKFKSAGYLGENKLALLEIRPGDIPAGERERVDEILRAENRDRQSIYNEIARQNQKTAMDDLLEIQYAWADVHRERAEAGDWVQVPTSDRYFRLFLRSAIGQKLSERPTPGAWIRVPAGVGN